MVPKTIKELSLRRRGQSKKKNLAVSTYLSTLPENLADVGYDAGSMSMEAYDWRLAFRVLEERDGYLTHLKHKIEAYHKYEYPGIHRMLLWSVRAVFFYNQEYTFTVNSGYRCSENNKQNGRASTNHCGKAIDIDVPRGPAETAEG